MRNPQLNINDRKFFLIGILVSVLFAVAAFLFEPRLFPLALFMGPALVALIFPPPGRRGVPRAWLCGPGCYRCRYYHASHAAHRLNSRGTLT